MHERDAHATIAPQPVAGTDRRHRLRLRAVDAPLAHLTALVGPGRCAQLRAGAHVWYVDVSGARPTRPASSVPGLLLQTPAGPLWIGPAREVVRALTAIDVPDDHDADPLHLLRMELALQAIPDTWFELFGASVALSCGPHPDATAEVTLTIAQSAARLGLAATLRGSAQALQQALARPGWQRLSGAAAPLPRDWTLRVPVHAGHARLSVQTCRALAAGDVVLLSDACCDPDGSVRVRFGRRTAICQLHFGNQMQLEITEWDDTTSGPTMDARLESSPYPSPDDDLDDVPVLLSFELGTLELDLGELKALTPGVVLPLAGPLPPEVAVCANGRRIGIGELVELDGRLGVELRRIGASS